MTEAEREELRLLVRQFAEEEVAPRVAECDRDEHLPKDLFPRMAELGFFGGTVPVEWGGMGLDHLTFTFLIEEMARIDHTLAVLMSMPSALVGAGLQRFGNDEQRERWLTPLARGDIFGAAAVTEPASGSDVAGLESTYERRGDRYVIRGAKAWISNLDIASFFITFASFDRSLRHRGISAFIIPADTPGLSTNPYKDKLGFRALCTGELVLDDVEVGPEALIGEEGGGFAVAMTAVETGRLAVAARAVAIAQACLEDTVAYARDRVVFGQPLGDFQMVKKKIADMSVEVEAARCLVRRCAEVLDEGRRARVEASRAKMFASDVAQRAATEAVQVHGAYGVSPEYRVGRLYRDAKVFQIVEGANDIHRLLIADYALGYRS